MQKILVDSYHARCILRPVRLEDIFSAPCVETLTETLTCRENSGGDYTIVHDTRIQGVLLRINTEIGLRRPCIHTHLYPPYISVYVAYVRRDKAKL